jgi:hypothetical protein
MLTCVCVCHPQGQLDHSHPNARFVCGLKLRANVARNYAGVFVCVCVCVSQLLDICVCVHFVIICCPHTHTRAQSWSQTSETL